jgi:hypothetical protein
MSSFIIILIGAEIMDYRLGYLSFRFDRALFHQ